MLTTHEAGGVAFGPVPAARAIELVERTHRRAAEQNFPLRLTLEKPDPQTVSIEASPRAREQPARDAEALAWERTADDEERPLSRWFWLVLALLAVAIALWR
jgi:hypothetical protein